MEFLLRSICAERCRAKASGTANSGFIPSAYLAGELHSQTRSRMHCTTPLLLLICTIASALPGAEPIMVLPWSDGRVEFIRDAVEAAANLGTSNHAVREVKAIAITWRIEYLDQTNHTGRGFDSPSAGADRRQALENTFASISAVLNGSGSRTVQVRVNRSLDSPGLTLASASSPVQNGVAGIKMNHLQQLIQTNVDPSPGNAEVVVQFNFHNSKLWHTGISAPPSDFYDLRSVALHELTHALGFSSWADAQGNSIASGTNPGVFSVFDSFIGQKSGALLFTSAGRFTGAAGDFIGASGGLSWYGPETVTVMGNAATLYTPPTYEPGSSVSHWGTTDREPVMGPSIAPGTRRRNYTDYEVALLRDIGYTDAALPKPLFRFDALVRFPAFADAVAVQNIDNQSGLDLIVLEQQGPDSVLRIFSGLNPNQVRTMKLPSERFCRMSSANVGPTYASGVVIGSLSQGTLLSLAGLTQPSTNRLLTLKDFAHVHRAMNPYSSPGTVYPAYSAVPMGDLNGDGMQDFVGYSKSRGFMPFVNDTRGYYDRLLRDREVIKLATFGTVVRDVAPYQLPTAPPMVPPAAGIDMVSGLANEIIVNVMDPPGTAEIRRLVTSPNMLVKRLSRFGASGFGVIVNNGREELVRVSFLSPLPAPYAIVNSWQLDSPIQHVLTLSSAPTNAVVATDGHTLEQIDSRASVIKRLAGSVQGYLDGPALTARFDRPLAMCEANGILYVVDAGNSLIRTVNLITGEVGTLTGQTGISLMMDGPKGKGTLAFNSSILDASNCAVIGESLYVMNAASTAGPFALRKINLNNGDIRTISPNQLGSYTFPRHLRSFDMKLYYVDDKYPSTALRGLELFPRNRTVDSSSLMLRLADLDNDGFDEVINMMDINSRPISISKTMPDGSFSFVSTFSVSVDPVLFEVWDIDNDGWKDVVVASLNSVQVYLGDGHCGFTLDQTRSLALGGSSNGWTIFDDVNTDGHIDVAAVDQGGTLRIYLSGADGKWGNGRGNSGEDFISSLPIGGQGPLSFQLSYLNDDTCIDLLMRPRGGNTIFILYGQEP
jgi:hypothetical protein